MDITTDHDKGQGYGAYEMTKCQHEHTHTEERLTSQCRYVPPTWERENDDDPFETVQIRDIYVWCDDCGECVECIAGD